MKKPMIWTLSLALTGCIFGSRQNPPDDDDGTSNNANGATNGSTNGGTTTNGSTNGTLNNLATNNNGATNQQSNNATTNGATNSQNPVCPEAIDVNGECQPICQVGCDADEECLVAATPEGAPMDATCARAAERAPEGAKCDDSQCDAGLVCTPQPDGACRQMCIPAQGTCDNPDTACFGTPFPEDVGLCLHPRYVLIQDTSPDDIECNGTDPGADIYGVELRASDGTNRAWGSRVVSDFRGDNNENTDVESTVDGSEPDLQVNDCPDEFQPRFSLGCGGWAAVQFLDETFTPVQPEAGDRVVVYELGADCSDPDGDDAYDISFCPAIFGSELEGGNADVCSVSVGAGLQGVESVVVTL